MPGRARGLSPGPVFSSVFVAVFFATIGANPVGAQLRRDAPLQSVGGVAKGDAVVGVGLARSIDAVFPLSGFEGDVWAIGEVTLAYGLGDRALVQLSGAVYRRLSIERAGPSSVTLDPATADGVTSDAGDFRITTAFAPIGSTEGVSAGGLVEVTLPNSDETKGIGTNTTDVTVGALGSWGRGGWRGTGMLGVAIRQAPLDGFEQNDLVAYALDLGLEVSSRLRIHAAIAGEGNVRRTTPLGTESRGAVTAGAEWLTDVWRFDGSLTRGYAGSTPDWRFSAGVSWTRTGGGG